MTLPLSTPADVATAIGAVTDHLVAVDFDGTLSPIVERPGDATPLPGAVDALRRLAACTPVAILSGRPVADLESRLDGVEVLLAGGHGSEVRDLDGQLHELTDREQLTAALDQAEQDIVRTVEHGTGWYVERKPTSLAVHHRLVPEDEEAALLPRVHALLEARRDDPPGFAVLQGKAVLELRPSSVDKGMALLWLLERHPNLTPLVIGDDETDEDAFNVAVALGGVTILVSEEERETAARSRVAGPDDVVALLGLLADRAGPDR